MDTEGSTLRNKIEFLNFRNKQTTLWVARQKDYIIYNGNNWTGFILVYIFFQKIVYLLVLRGSRKKQYNYFLLLRCSRKISWTQWFLYPSKLFFKYKGFKNIATRELLLMNHFWENYYKADFSQLRDDRQLRQQASY